MKVKNANMHNVWKWLALSAVIAMADQWTKQLVTEHFLLFESINVFPGFNLTLLYNEGAAFSFLSDAGGMQRWFFIVVTLIVSAFLLYEMFRQDNKSQSEMAGFSLVLGGAIGNLIDRVMHGYVVDFLDVYYQSHHWPAFNIADSAITTGVVFLLYNYIYRTERKD
jgi:signal peptidase II